MVTRTEYLQKLLSWKDEKVIKVITGMRRSGKSTLLKQFQELLINSDISNDQIQYINFEDLDNENLLDYQNLYNELKNKLIAGKKNYIFLDEIQNVANYEKVVDSLYIQENVDIYITGSNAYMLSSDLSTLLSGRYVEINILPLSFKEYYELNCTETKESAFNEYMRFGGLPYLATMQKTPEKVSLYIEGIYNTVIVKDIEDRTKRSHENKSIDTNLLKTISKYLADVIGNPVSIKGIADYLCSNNRKTSDHTVADYTDLLCEAFVFYKSYRFDIKGKELLKTNAKYYIVDTGIKNYLINKKGFDLGFTLENIVYLQLIRKGFKVNVGKLNTKEVDFIAQKNGEIEYYQVSATMTSESTFNREISVLEEIKDNYKKTILTMDTFTEGNYNGIIVKNVINWLLEQ